MEINHLKCSNLRFKLEFYAVKALERILPVISGSTRHLIATIFGIIGYYFIPIRKGVMLENLRASFPKESENWYKRVALQTYINFSKIFFDLFPLYRCGENEFRYFINTINRERIEESIGKGRSFILLMFHFGSWDAIANWFSINGYNFGAVFKRQRNPFVNEFLITVRESRGIKLFPLNGSTDRLLKFLKRDSVLALVADQDAGKKGKFIKFFNQSCSAFRGPAVISRRLKSPIVAGICLLKGRRYELTFKEISTDVPEDTKEEPVRYLIQRYTNYFEGIIKEHPSQYFWFHRRWKTRQPININS